MNKTSIISALGGILLFSPAFARVFNTSLKLKVYVRGSGEIPDRVLGFTPSRRGHPVRLPPHRLWYVRPVGPVNAGKLEQLARVLRREKIPGLDLSDHWELANESMSHLRSLPHLALLDISRTKISDAGLAHLKSDRALSVLMLPDSVTDKGLRQLKSLQNLRELNLDQTRITDDGLNGLVRLTRLEDLDLSSTHTTDAGVASLTKLPRLRRLVLGAAITDFSAPHLAQLRNLREIDLSQTQIGAQALAALASLPKLETVYLGKPVTDAGLQALSPSRSLRTLDLTRTGITDKGVKHLAAIKTLEEISLSETSVGNACLSWLAELPELRMLELSGTRVTSAGLAPLVRLKKLEVISLSWQTLSRDDLQGMAKLKQLKTIVLNGVPLPEATMAQLRRLGAPSPWDSVAGLEHAQVRQEQKLDQRVIGAPVTPAAKNVTPAILKTPLPLRPPLEPRRASADAVVAGRERVPPSLAGGEGRAFLPMHPSSKEEPMLPKKPESIETRKTKAPAGTKEAELVSKEPAPHPELRSPSPARGEGNVTTAIAPVDVVPKKVSEDNLLHVITLQSNPSHAGGFSGLSGMRQLRNTETVASLNTITADTSQTTIREQEDKPENYLGDISVGASRSR